jgi:hypothetical protein
MDDNELKTGDLIFYLDTLGTVEHIALYANHKLGIPYVVHAVTAPYNSVMLTCLKKPDHGCSYKVMRPINTDLALISTGILFRWVEHQVPFATREKRDLLINTLDKEGGFDNVDAGKIQESYGKKGYESNFLQYLLMANALPYIAEEDGAIKGLRCAEAIVAAFNIALVISHATLIRKKSVEDGYEWVLNGYPS